MAFNTTALALPLITVGFVMGFVWKQGVVRRYGAMLLGLGLIFYGMAVVGSAMAPLRTHEGFAALLQSLQNPFLGILVGAVFTALVQSSSATIGLAVVMATQGLLSLPAGIAILFGAKNWNGDHRAILAAIGKPLDAVRTAAIHVLFNVIGALIWLPFIPQLAAVAGRFRRWPIISRAWRGSPRRRRARSPTPPPSGPWPTPSSSCRLPRCLQRWPSGSSRTGRCRTGPSSAQSSRRRTDPRAVDGAGARGWSWGTWVV